MALLLLFALIAGFATCLSPCVLPVLPLVLSGGTTGGKRRPLGIVTGLVVSFTFAVVALVYVIAALGLPNDVMRTFAVVVLVAFGLSLIVPAVGARLEAWLGRFGRVAGDPAARGFESGFVLGLGLGVLYAPCAGPILAGVITVSAAQTFTAGRLAVALAYAVGSAVGLYLIMLGGRRVAGRIVSRSVRVQQALGVLMVAMGIAVSTNLDVRFQTAVAAHLPGFLLAPSQEIQSSEAVSGQLDSPSGPAAGNPHAPIGDDRGLPVYGRAPDFVGTQQWFNTPGDRPLSLSDLHGQVVLVDFWTYTCINCIRTLPELKALYERYHSDGLEVVGVHSPEFPFEKEASNVQAAIDQNRLPYPVVQDNDLATWTAYENQYWPADYLIDADGRIRYAHYGEGAYDTTERAVRTLLAQAGTEHLGEMTHTSVARPSRGVTTPESYLGAERAEGFTNGPIQPGRQSFSFPGRPPADHLAYGGAWKITNNGATAERSARVDLNFNARRVFLVMGSPDRPSGVGALLDGKPIPGRLAGADVQGSRVIVGPHRLYRLVDLARVERHVLTLHLEPGISAYAFTFG